MEKRRGESRKARAKTGMPVVSLVGYTNVGKSSLMNALCGPSVAEADMLFATLDPTSRKLVLPSGMAVLLVDTVASSPVCPTIWWKHSNPRWKRPHGRTSSSG